MAKSQKQARPAAGTPGAPVENSGAQESQSQQQNAEALLRADHRKVEQLFKQFESEKDSNRKKELARQACNELIVHSMLEEEIFYPACREKNVADDLLDEAQVEHDSLKLLISDLKQSEPDSPFFDAKVSVLSEYVRHHVREEEKAITGIFAKAQKAGVEMDLLGQRLQERKQQLMMKVESGEIEVPAPRSIQGAPRALSRNREDTLMAREFDSNDDRGFGPESGRGRFGGRYTREQDEETGGREFARAGYSRYEGMGGTRDSYASEQGRGDYSGRGERGYSGSGGRSRYPDEYSGSGRGYGGYGGFSDYRSGGAGRGEYGSSRDYYGGGTSRGRFGGGDYPGGDDYRGSSGGYPRGTSGGSGSFERENDDYRRGMGSQDRGRMAGGRTSRDEDYSSLGRRSRFGGGGNDRERQRGDDDFEYMSGGGRSGGWRDRE
jgi:hemerythrin superfamily protein